MKDKSSKIIIVLIIIFIIIVGGYILDSNFEEKCNNKCYEEKQELIEKYENKINELQKEIDSYEDSK